MDIREAIEVCRDHLAWLRDWKDNTRLNEIADALEDLIKKAEEELNDR